MVARKTSVIPLILFHELILVRLVCLFDLMSSIEQMWMNAQLAFMNVAIHCAKTHMDLTDAHVTRAMSM